MTVARWRAAGLLWPALLTLGAFAVLIGLGSWQMQRKAWKEGLISAIETRVDATPRPLDGSFLVVGGPLGAEYARVTASGRFLHEQERHLYMPAKEGPGWLVITPMQRADGSLVLVNRGWVPDRLRNPATRRHGQVTGPIEVVGLLRKPEAAGTFTPANNRQKNIWYWRDIEAMWRCQPGTESTPQCAILQAPRSAAVPAGTPQHYPLLIDAEATPANPGGWPRGGTTRLELPNRHLEYALTWYGLAATLVGVFVAFAATRLRALPGA